ncbi:NU3M oxidoreductase, partial [Acromyrmex charruanus]
YKRYLINFIILFALPSILFLINVIISKKYLNQEKIFPFECEFNPISRARLPSRTQFFIISHIFLFFDIQIAFLVTLIYILINFNPFTIFYYLYFFYLF